MKSLIFILSLISFYPLLAQHPSEEAISKHPYTLEERYQILKLKTQNWEDYKVIKGFVLDGIIKITMDSIRANRTSLKAAIDTIARLKSDVRNMQETLRQKELSMEGTIYDSEHIGVAGISFEKKTFVVLVTVVVIGLLALLGGIVGKLRIMQSSVKERADFADALTLEFEDYKHKALDKQTKLSRELQTERNKLMELKRG